MKQKVPIEQKADIAYQINELLAKMYNDYEIIRIYAQLMTLKENLKEMKN